MYLSVVATLARMLALTVAIGIFFLTFVDIQRAAAGIVSCGNAENSEVIDQNFIPTDSGITRAKLQCGQEEYCDFGRNSDGNPVRPGVSNSMRCGRDNQFMCTCRMIAGDRTYRDIILEVAPTGSKKVSCGATLKVNSQAGESGVKEASLVCDNNVPRRCVFKYVDSSIKESEVQVSARGTPQPCGRNNDYLCYCIPRADGGAFLGVRKNGQPKNDS